MQAVNKILIQRFDKIMKKTLMLQDSQEEFHDYS